MATFDWIPYLEGKYLSYYQIGALIFSAICLLFAFIAFIGYLIASKININQLMGRGNTTKVARSFKNGCYIAIFAWLGFIPMVCQALDVLNLIEGIIGMLLVYILGMYLHNGIQATRQLRYRQIQMQFVHQQPTSTISLQNNEQRLAFLGRCLKRRAWNKKTIIIAVVLSVFFNLFFYKTCVAFYNDEIGYTSNFFGPAINTYWARWLELKRSCPPGPPCHAYATIPQDPTTAFFLNLHTHADLKQSVIVYYQQLLTTEPDDFVTKKAQSFSYDQLEWLASRKVHSVLICDLKPNTKYLIKVKYDNQFYLNTIYKTLPSDPSIPVTMMNAGDSGYTFASHNLSKIVVGYKPDIIFIGGDVAYDNNIPSCAYTWDFFLAMIQGISNEVGQMVPLVLALGNHDAGLNQLSHTNITLDTTAFFKYFPQQFQRDGTGNILQGVPAVKDRRSFLNFRWGQVSYTILDSGYLHSFHGLQKQFLRDTLNSSQNMVKFVNYHVPIYSVCERFDKNPQRFLYALFHWIPLFDQYRVMTVFQNHVHSFKRTKPLKSSQPAQNGTVYVGDGAYGAVLTFLCKPDVTMDIFQVYKPKNNMWISEIRAGQVHHLAIDSLGNKIDEFIQDHDAYRK